MASENSDGPILLCWDGSSSAASAIAHAAQILGPGRRAIVVLAHVPTEQHAGVLGGLPSLDAPVVGTTEAEGMLEEGLRVAQEAGFEATGQRIVADRKTADIIVAVAEHEHVPLIVMGQRGRSGLKAALLGLGSVAQGVLAAYDGPLLLVGRDSAGPTDAS